MPDRRCVRPPHDVLHEGAIDLDVFIITSRALTGAIPSKNAATLNLTI